VLDYLNLSYSDEKRNTILKNAEVQGFSPVYENTKNT